MWQKATQAAHRPVRTYFVGASMLLRIYSNRRSLSFADPAVWLSEGFVGHIVDLAAIRFR